MESIYQQYLYFDDLIFMMHEFWIIYQPGGESFDNEEISEIDDAFIERIVDCPFDKCITQNCSTTCTGPHRPIK
jgi:hypothetical protein